jgi:hypothetical protein
LLVLRYFVPFFSDLCQQHVGTKEADLGVPPGIQQLKARLPSLRLLAEAIEPLVGLLLSLAYTPIEGGDR